MIILGISAFYHDSSATIIKDNEIIASAQEERFTRIKHDNSFPLNSIDYCLNSSQIQLSEIDEVIYYENPNIKLFRILKSNFNQKNFLNLMQIFLGINKFFIKQKIKKILENFYQQKVKKVVYSLHHKSHALSAFIPSKYNEALVVCLDGVGEFHSTTVWSGKNGELDLIWKKNFPDSLGILYSAFTYFCGFKVNFGEYKLMGLAPYGNPKFVDIIKKHIITANNDGDYFLNEKYFNFAGNQEIISDEFKKLFGIGRRNPEENIKQVYMDLAASVQKIIEEVVLNICRYFSNKTGLKKLCLSGGVALNCVANGYIAESKIFDDIWIQPASGDAGCSLGAALLYTKKLRKNFSPYLGPSFSNDEIAEILKLLRINSKKYNKFEELAYRTSEFLEKKKIVGWFQDKMEFGPRALGNRSILADPRQQNIQKDMNLKIKFRESFRPFAPIILHSELSKYFNFELDSPYMLFTSKIKEKFRIENEKNKLEGLQKINEINSIYPGITHVDFSSRLQSVKPEDNYKLHVLLKSFFQSTGCPMLINTSFNVRGEPIVCTPIDAIKCFLNTNIDILVLNDFIIKKEEIDLNVLKDQDYLNQFELD